MASNLMKPFFILAPMDDVTDTVFRRVVYDCAPFDLSMTEFVNVDGLCSPGREKLLPRLSVTNDRGPVIAQIWGKKPDNFEQIAREIASGEIPGFVGIDLNFGCPEKSVVKNECCSALAQPQLRDQAGAIIEATMKGAQSSDQKLPVSIKTRLGFRETDYTWHEFLLGFKPSMLTVHVRTTKQMSKVPAQWEAIAPIVKLRDFISPDTKIVLNGDIADREHGEQLAREYGVDGVMIGRGVFKNPYCFAENAQETWDAMTRLDRIYLLKKHFDLFRDTYSEGERKFDPLKKFAKVYISDFDGASDLRARIMESTSIEEAMALLV